MTVTAEEPTLKDFRMDYLRQSVAVEMAREQRASYRLLTARQLNEMRARVKAVADEVALELRQAARCL